MLGRSLKESGMRSGNGWAVDSTCVSGDRRKSEWDLKKLREDRDPKKMNRLFSNMAKHWGE